MHATMFVVNNRTVPKQTFTKGTRSPLMVKMSPRQKYQKVAEQALCECMSVAHRLGTEEPVKLFNGIISLGTASHEAATEFSSCIGEFFL